MPLDSDHEKENDINMQDVLQKMIRKAANSPAEVVLKYIVIGVLALFGVVVWYTWQSNLQQPERLYSLLERSIQQQDTALSAQSMSIALQQSSLDELVKFTALVGKEHGTHDAKLATIIEALALLRKENVGLQESIQAHTRATESLTEAVQRMNGL